MLNVNVPPASTSETQSSLSIHSQNHNNINMFSRIVTSMDLNQTRITNTMTTSTVGLLSPNSPILTANVISPSYSQTSSNSSTINLQLNIAPITKTSYIPTKFPKKDGSEPILGLADRFQYFVNENVFKRNLEDGCCICLTPYKDLSTIVCFFDCPHWCCHDCMNKLMLNIMPVKFDFCFMCRQQFSIYDGCFIGMIKCTSQEPWFILTRYPCFLRSTFNRKFHHGVHIKYDSYNMNNFKFYFPQFFAHTLITKKDRDLHVLPTNVCNFIEWEYHKYKKDPSKFKRFTFYVLSHKKTVDDRIPVTAITVNFSTMKLESTLERCKILNKCKKNKPIGRAGYIFEHCK